MNNADLPMRYSGLVYSLMKQQSYRHIETSQLICRTDQFTDFDMMTTLAFNLLI